MRPRRQRLLLLVAAGLASAALGCAAPAVPAPDPLPPRARPALRAASATRLAAAPSLRPGPAVAGRTGDFELHNDRILAVVRSLGVRWGGGALVDLGSRRARHDALGALVPLVGTKLRALRAPRYHKLHLERLGQSARLRLEGIDRRHPQVHVETYYLLDARGFVLDIVTTLRNSGRHPIANYRVADRIHLGATDAFLPGLGWAVGSALARVDRVEAYGREVSYAYRHEGTMVEVQSDDGELVASGPPQTLEPGLALTTRRQLVLGDAGWCTGLQAPLLARRNETPVAIAVAGLDERNEPLAHGIVEVLRQGAPACLARLGDDGRASLQLTAGAVAMRLSGTGRRSPLSPTATLAAGDRQSIELTTGPPSQLVFDVRESATRRPLPLRLRIEPADGGPRPWFGSPAEARPRNFALATSGRGVLPLPPGRYQVTVDAGPLHGLVRREVTLAPHAGASLVLHLDAVDVPRELVAVDAWQPVADGLRSVVTPEARRDWNLVAGYAAVLARPPRDVHWVLTGAPADHPRQLRTFLAALRAGRRAVAAAGTRSRTLLEAPFQTTRTWVRSVRGEGALRKALEAGRSTLGNGALLLLEVDGKRPGELLSLPRRRRGAPAPLATVRVRLLAPAHVLLEDLRLYVDGKPRGDALAVSGRKHGLRLDATIRLAFTSDASLLAVARGKIDPALTAGRVVKVQALTNALWVDVDGDGRWRGQSVAPGTGAGQLARQRRQGVAQ